MGNLRVAHVGATPGDPNVEHCILRAEMYLAKIGSPLASQVESARQDDFIDLGRGRDFLQEAEEYDLVLVQYIYDGNPNDPERPGSGRGLQGQRPGEGMYGPHYLAVSPRHSPGRWRLRLAQTGAEAILVFGGRQELSYDVLGTIPGYSVRLNEPDRFVLYTRG